MSLLVRHCCGAYLPETVRRRLDRDYECNRQRLVNVRVVFHEAAAALRSVGIDCAVLKGFAGASDYSPDANARVQYDLDLYCPHRFEAARDALLSLGYESAASLDAAADHLPPLVRKTGWQWRGDFFDPAIPISIELHHRLWDARTEGLAAPGLEIFWDRRVEVRDGPLHFFALRPVDAFGYKSLHALRHLLRGEFRAAHLHELAWFLHHRAEDDAFWGEWRSLHPPRLRVLQAQMARMAEAWFGCRMHGAVRAEVDSLPPRVARWLDRCAASPAESYFHPNKDELWLHLCQLDSARERVRVLRRRLAPLRLPGALDSVFLPRAELTLRVRWRKRIEYARYAASRALFHTRALLPTLSRIIRMSR